MERYSNMAAIIYNTILITRVESRRTFRKSETPMADEPEVMNILQASRYLGMSPDTLYKYVSENSIPAFKLGNRWKFKKTVLDA